MEKTVKKLLVATGLVASAAVAILPLTSYAVSSDYNCDISDTCARADQNGSTEVTVNIAPLLAIDAVTMNCIEANGDTCVDVATQDSEGNAVTTKAIQAYPGMVRTGTLTARVRSAKPFTISISAEDPYLKRYDADGELASVIPSNSTVDGAHSAWGIQKSGAADGVYSGISNQPAVFLTNNVPQDDFANFDFKIGVSATDKTAQGFYSTEVTVTAATTDSSTN